MWLTAAMRRRRGAVRAVDVPAGRGARGARSRGAARHARRRCSLIVLFALLRPMLLLKVAVPQQNFVGILLDDSRSMQVADHDGKPRSSRSPRDEFGTPGRAAAHRARQALQPPDLPVLVVGRAAAVHGRSEVRGHGHAAGRRARSRAQRTERPAGRGPGRRDRRLGQRRTDDRRVDRRPQVAGHAGVCRRRRQGAADARRPGDARRDAAPRAQGRVARARRRRDAGRVRRQEGAAGRRRRRPHRRHAGNRAAG